MKPSKVIIGMAIGAVVCVVAIFAALPLIARAQAGATPTPQPGVPPADSYGAFGPRAGFHDRGRSDEKTLISATASVTGLTAQEVLTELRNGKSLAQIAQDKGKTADDIVQAARTLLQDQLNQDVKLGWMTQAQAGAALADFDQSASQLVNATGFGAGPGFGPDFGRGRKDGFGHEGEGALISATASVTGLTAQEVVTELRNGKSLAQIAQDKGKTADDIVQAARTQLEDQLKQTVTAGRLTQAQADAMLAEFDQSASQLVNATGFGAGPGFGPDFGRGRKDGFGHEGEGALISATASVTGLTAQEVVTELRNGKSLAQIAQDKGKTADDVVQAARAQLEDQLKQAVTAGRLTQAQSDAILAQFDQTASQLVNDTAAGQRFGGWHDFNRTLPPTPTPSTNTSSTSGSDS